jgi:hypothetical protein
VAKKRRKDRVEQGPPADQMVVGALPLSAMMGAMGLRMPVPNRPTVAGVAATVEADTDIAKSWVAQSEDRCCPHPFRDGLLVILGTEGKLREVREFAANPTAEFVQVTLVNEHHGFVASAMMDLEAMERHVNNCTEAIATMRARRVYHGEPA